MSNCFSLSSFLPYFTPSGQNESIDGIVAVGSSLRIHTGTRWISMFSLCFSNGSSVSKPEVSTVIWWPREASSSTMSLRITPPPPPRGGYS